MATDRTARARLSNLSRRERQIMDVLYQRGQATVNDVVDALADAPSYSAVRATLNTLVAKAQAQFREEGRRYVYLPAIPADAARNAALRHLVRTFFGGSSEDAAVALLQTADTQMTRDAVDRLTRQIQKARTEGR
ncbi:MAG TPA: BlaI/MecI/CopY family transcriptional regulator [Gemmatimonadaceae bacterium]|nr:BlaI/MecI/CopY family transcriptional regulator [Gemmatimonadaceae bacterium]